RGMGSMSCDATGYVSGRVDAVQRLRTDCRPSHRAELDCREQRRQQRWQRLCPRRPERHLVRMGKGRLSSGLRLIIGALATWILAWALGGRARKPTGTQQRQKHARKSDEQTDENAQV